MEIIIAAAAVVLFILWAISCRRKLAVMDEDINNAMARIGVQLSSRFDVLATMLDLTREYAVHESQTLITTVQSQRSFITAASTPEDVQKQEGVIFEALVRISTLAELYPALKADENYAKCVNAMDSYEKLERTSRLIYNAGVTKLNRELRMFPTSLFAGFFGFRQREYLEAAENKADLPRMK